MSERVGIWYPRLVACGLAAKDPLKRSFVVRLYLLAVSLSVCGAVSLGTPAPALSTAPGLFTDTDSTRPAASAPQIERFRFVKVNLALLLDETGQSRTVKEIRLNFFPDVSYQGMIVQIEPNGDGYSWVGYLKDVENSSLTMLYTSGAFIGHFASPLGIYEVSSAGDGLYQVVKIDQSKFPGGDEKENR